MIKPNFQLPLFLSQLSSDPLEIILICWFGGYFIFSVFLFFQNLGFFTYKVTTEPEIMAAVIIYFP